MKFNQTDTLYKEENGKKNTYKMDQKNLLLNIILFKAHNTFWRDYLRYKIMKILDRKHFMSSLGWEL